MISSVHASIFDMPEPPPRRPIGEQFKGIGRSMVLPESEVRQPPVCPFCHKPMIHGGPCPSKEKGECGPADL